MKFQSAAESFASELGAGHELLCLQKNETACLASRMRSSLIVMVYGSLPLSTIHQHGGTHEFPTPEGYIRRPNWSPKPMVSHTCLTMETIEKGAATAVAFSF